MITVEKNGLWWYSKSECLPAIEGFLRRLPTSTFPMSNGRRITRLTSPLASDLQEVLERSGAVRT